MQCFSALKKIKKNYKTLTDSICFWAKPFLIKIKLNPLSPSMAVERHKPLDEASCIARFYRIILSWDFIRLVNEAKVISVASSSSSSSSISHIFTVVI